jgi:hypothetical protein
VQHHAGGIGNRLLCYLSGKDVDVIWEDSEPATKMVRKSENTFGKRSQGNDVDLTKMNASPIEI